ncbi:MAG: pimeloyl-ACP methyl ester carboxylesterase [Hydrogenophaga sp.]|jgi:pimeloyl-ACP methyl ester carboxylesterase
MNPSNTPPPNTTPVAADLAEQANPGQGIPSQDPSGAAQTLLKPHEAKREADSALVGGGLVAGATPEKAQQMKRALEQDRSAFFDQFTEDFFCANGVIQVTESQRAEAVALCRQSAQQAALACMDAFGITDWREDPKQVTVPTLVIHGEADAIVPIEGSGLRTHRAVLHSKLVVISGAPHGLNVSHAQAFNDALLSFLRV